MDEYKIKHIEEGLTQIEFPEFDKISSDAPVFFFFSQVIRSLWK